MKCADLMRLISLAACAAACFSTCASAQDLRPASLFVEGGVGSGRLWTSTVGGVWPGSWRSDLGAFQFGGVTEAFLTGWSAEQPGGGRRSFTQVGLLPLLRVRSGEGSAAWFLEAGIGLSLTDRVFTSVDRQFATRFNFVDVLGVGRSFGAAQAQELGLRITHVSNGGIRQPNPGQNLLQLRYARMF